MNLTHRIPRPTENQALFAFTGADGSWRRMCHVMHPTFTCAHFLEVPSMGHYSV